MIIKLAYDFSKYNLYNYIFHLFLDLTFSFLSSHPTYYKLKIMTTSAMVKEDKCCISFTFDQIERRGKLRVR